MAAHNLACERRNDDRPEDETVANRQPGFDPARHFPRPVGRPQVGWRQTTATRPQTREKVRPMWWLLELIAAMAGAPAQRASERSLLIYRSCDGSAFFRFGVTPEGRDLRIHILDFPNAEVGSCHVLNDDRG